MSTLREKFDRVKAGYPQEMQASLVVPLLMLVQEEKGHIESDDAGRCSRAVAAAAATHTPLPLSYHRLFWWWFGFGFPAFFAVLAIFWLMTARPQLPSAF